MSAAAAVVPFVTPAIRQARATLHDAVLGDRKLKDASKTAYTVVYRLCYLAGETTAAIGFMADRAGMSVSKFQRAVKPLEGKYVWWVRTGRENRWSIIGAPAACPPKSDRSESARSDRSDRSTVDRSHIRNNNEIYETETAAAREPDPEPAKPAVAAAAVIPIEKAKPPAIDPDPETAALAGYTCAELRRRQLEPDRETIARKLAGKTRQHVDRAFAEFDQACRREPCGVGLFLTKLRSVESLAPAPEPPPSPPPVAPDYFAALDDRIAFEEWQEAEIDQQLAAIPRAELDADIARRVKVMGEQRFFDSLDARQKRNQAVLNMRVEIRDRLPSIDAWRAENLRK